MVILGNHSHRIVDKVTQGSVGKLTRNGFTDSLLVVLAICES